MLKKLFGKKTKSNSTNSTTKTTKPKPPPTKPSIIKDTTPKTTKVEPPKKKSKIDSKAMDIEKSISQDLIMDDIETKSTNNELNDDDNDFDEFDNDDFDDGNDEEWDDIKLEFGQKQISLVKEEDSEAVLKRALEKKRIEQADKSKFWSCGKCNFLNHPSRAICMACQMPQLDIVHHVLTCKDMLKKCPNCCALVIPTQFEDHIDTCQPMPGIDGKNQNWYCELTECEKKAVNHVTSKAIERSNSKGVKQMLLNKFKQINKEYNEETLVKLQNWLEWQAPITIRIHVGKLIPKLMKDTKYRNLFEIGKGSGGNDKNRRKLEEGKMFGPVYDKAKATERPKYGCINVGLKPEGDLKAKSYGDGYFLMNDTTIRWRSTMTIGDSFGVNGNCGTLKHCLHLLKDLGNDELKQLIEAALYKKKGDDKQKQYREVQIHGPVILNRDVTSLHCPKNQKIHEKKFKKFCEKNGCKLVWF